MLEFLGPEVVYTGDEVVGTILLSLSTGNESLMKSAELEHINIFGSPVHIGCGAEGRGR